MNSEFIPLCIHVWKSFAHNMNQMNFVTSLLLTTIELNCHLELIVNLLRIEVNNDKPSMFLLLVTSFYVIYYVYNIIDICDLICQ